MIFSTRQPKNPSSKRTKRLIESQQIAEKRREKTKKYQHAKKQRSTALAKNALVKAETSALDDPHTSQAYDLWNAQDERKGFLQSNILFLVFQDLHFLFKEKVQALVGPALASYTDQVIQKYQWKVPKHIIKKPTKLPAIETPLPGTSYNPTYDDHQVNDQFFLLIMFTFPNHRIYFVKLLMLKSKNWSKKLNFRNN